MSQRAASGLAARHTGLRGKRSEPTSGRPAQGVYAHVVQGRARRGAVVLAALLLGATAVPVPAVARTAEPDTLLDDTAPDPVAPAERTAAIAEPAIVVVEVTWEGYVRDRDSRALLDPEPVSATAHCTGAGVGAGGYLLTTATCLRMSAVALQAFGEVVNRRVADGRTPEDQASDLLANLLLNATIGGADISDDETSGPRERSVVVRRAVTDDEPLPASVVAIADPDDGDAALLKIARSNQPILPLAEGASVGEELVIVECPAVQDEADPGTGVTPTGGEADDTPVEPAFRTAVVTDKDPHVLVEPVEPQTVTGTGGVVLNHDAQIVGLRAISLPHHDVLVDTSVIRGLLAEAEAENELGQVDRDYRAGLDAYYAGEYTESIERFDSVLAIIPSHVQAHEYRDEAQAMREEQGGDEPPAPGFDDRLDRFINGRQGSLVGLGVLLAILVFLVRRHRPPQAAAAGATPPEAPVSPPTARAPENADESP